MQDSNFVSLSKIPASEFQVVTAEQKVLVFNDNLEQLREFNVGDLYFLWYDWGNTRLITNAEEAYVVDKAGGAIAKIPGVFTSIESEGNLFIARGSELLQIDLENLEP